MGAKSKKRRGKLLRADSSPLDEAKRQYSRRNFREAVKEARRAHRLEPSDATRDYLQVATLARVRELQQHGLREQARALAADLLEMGVTEPSVRQELPSVLATLGMLDRATGGDGGAAVADPAVLKTAADQAVARPEEAPRSLPEIREGALLVRAALEAVEAGRDEEASEKLRSVSRHSPFSDWRLFVRGLIAYYRGDNEAMAAAWDRLEPGRAAVQITKPLRALAESGSGKQSDFQSVDFLKAEKAVLGNAVLGDLIELQRAVGAGKWKDTVAVLRRLRPALQRLDPALWSNVCSFLYRSLLLRGNAADLSQLKSWFDPPAIDPHWHRAKAMILEHEEGVLEADEHWRCYLNGLDQVLDIPPEQRSLARAMIGWHLGMLWVDEAISSQDDVFGTESRAPDEDDLATAIDYLEPATKIAPDYAPAYRVLAEAYRHAGRRRNAVRTLERLLEQHPDDSDALLALADECRQQGDPLKARPFLERAANLKPLDREIRGRIWINHVAAARVYALKEQFDLGRSELDAAASMPRSGDVLDYAIPVRRAVLELKAGNRHASQQLIEQAKRAAQDEAPVLLMLVVEAIRYRLPKEFLSGFERDLKAAMKRRCSSAAAGEMSRIMLAFLASETTYPKRKAHSKQVVSYLARSSRVRWKAEDLRRVCEFLARARDEEEVAHATADKVLMDRLRKGREEFPDDPYFLITSAVEEIALGPYDCDRRLAHRWLTNGLAMAERSGNPRDAELVKTAKRKLSFLDEVGLERSSPMLGFFDDDDDEDDEDEDEDDFDDEDYEATISQLAGIPYEAMPAFARAMINEMADLFDVPPEEVMRRMASATSAEEAARRLGGPHFGFRSPKKTKKTRKTRRK